MDKYVCDICGYVYDPAEGDPDNGVAPGTPWEQVPATGGGPLWGEKKDHSPKQKAEPGPGRETARPGAFFRPGRPGARLDTSDGT